MYFTYFISVACPNITQEEIETLQASYELSIALDRYFPILGREVYTNEDGYGFQGANQMMVERLTSLARNICKEVHFFISYQNLSSMDFVSVSASDVLVDQYEYQGFDLPNGQRALFQVRPYGANDITGMLAF